MEKACEAQDWNTGEGCREPAEPDSYFKVFLCRIHKVAFSLNHPIQLHPEARKRMEECLRAPLRGSIR